MNEKDFDRMLQAIEIGCLIGMLIMLIIYTFS